MTELERAISFAAEAHGGQLDRRGEPYVLHVLRVMLAVSPEARRVAVLHDVAEDTEWSVAQISSDLELTPAEREALQRLTRDDAVDGGYERYIESIASARLPGGVLAREVKVADLRDNLGRWVPELGDALKDRYERALERLKAVDGPPGELRTYEGPLYVRPVARGIVLEAADGKPHLEEWVERALADAGVLTDDDGWSVGGYTTDPARITLEVGPLRGSGGDSAARG